MNKAGRRKRILVVEDKWFSLSKLKESLREMREHLALHYKQYSEQVETATSDVILSSWE